MLLVDDEQARCVTVGERMQQDRVDDREDCGAGANAQRKREHRDGGKGSVFAERPEGVADVLKHVGHCKAKSERRAAEAWKLSG